MQINEIIKRLFVLERNDSQINDAMAQLEAGASANHKHSEYITNDEINRIAIEIHDSAIKGLLSIERKCVITRQAQDRKKGIELFDLNHDYLNDEITLDVKENSIKVTFKEPLIKPMSVQKSFVSITAINQTTPLNVRVIENNCASVEFGFIDNEGELKNIIDIENGTDIQIIIR